jgi:hypothetical protein
MVRRLLLTLGLVLFVVVNAFADTKPIPRLIEMVSTDAIPEFRLAAARTLVAAYLFIERPLSELDPSSRRSRKSAGSKNSVKPLKKPNRAR